MTQLVGGPGGAAFSRQCPAGQPAVGISARAGSWVDGFAVLCRSASGDLQQTEWTGGSSGSPQEIYCPPGQEISAAYFTFTRGNDLPKEFVNTIGITCGTSDIPIISSACILSGDTYDDELSQDCGGRVGWGSVGADLNVSADHATCPSGEVLTGLHGRSWKYVDAIGLICGSRTAAAAAPDEPGTAPGGGPAYSLGDRVIGTSPSFAVRSGSTVQHSPIVDLDPRSSLGAPGVGDSTMMRHTTQPGVGQPGACKSGFVWREAGPGDLVCVPPDSRDRVQLENQLAEARRNPAAGSGPMGCKAGFVWREAFPSDLACVDPEIRDLVRAENALAGTRAQ